MAIPLEYEKTNALFDKLECQFQPMVDLFMLRVASKAPDSIDVWWGRPVGRYSSLCLSDHLYIVVLLGTHN